MAAHQLNSIKTLHVKTCWCFPQTEVWKTGRCSAGKGSHFKARNKLQTAKKPKPQLVVVVKRWLNVENNSGGFRRRPQTGKYFGLKLGRGKKQTEVEIFDSASQEVNQILEFTCATYHSYLNMELSRETSTVACIIDNWKKFEISRT